ncbi:MAG: flavodoxin domain-containing protein, partial [candidate division KSB1 bacterium]|nr:flavodoxin domain-containing protein [candidate division KSB1 bacterium]
MDVLIAYSSGYGATKEVAERIGEILGQDAAINVRVENLDNLQGEDVEAFDAVVIGSSVRAE